MYFIYILKTPATLTLQFGVLFKLTIFVQWHRYTEAFELVKYIIVQ